MSAVENTSRGTYLVSHWFDGFAHTHKFDIIAPSVQGGMTTVTYSSRRQSDELVESIKKKGWRAGVTFAQRSDPCVGIFAKAMSVFAPASQININVAVHRNLSGLASKAPAGSGHRTGSNNIFLTTDQDILQDIHPDTLEPLGSARQSYLHPELKGLLSCAHAQRDRETGDMFNFNLQMGQSTTYRVFRVNASTGTTDILATILEPGIHPAYIHSFFLTENFVILCIPSTHFGWSGAKIPWHRNVLDAIKPFDKSYLCKWLVIDRRHAKGVIARFSTPAGFFFHSVNAFEENVWDEDSVKQTDIYLDYINFGTSDIIKSFYYDIILDRQDSARKHWIRAEHEDLNPRFVRQRFRIPLHKQVSKDAVAEEILSIPNPHAGELPSINPAFAYKPYRYFYSICNRGLSTIADSLVKTDLVTRNALIWCGPQGHSPGEPIFVARPDATEEDDGIILSVVLDGSAQKSYMLCLDAQTMTEVGRAEADFPIAIGLHGTHAPDRPTGQMDADGSRDLFRE